MCDYGIACVCVSRRLRMVCMCESSIAFKCVVYIWECTGICVCVTACEWVVVRVLCVKFKCMCVRDMCMYVCGQGVRMSIYDCVYIACECVWVVNLHVRV